ncbi:hypothetical protein A3D77_07015 [Candidatus Gottesmanbacteria bacterium RIFCSPHIGHO2_02_FULL_39_11]|uniref:Uncharacterized protein n=1 Tax=Candidatus Gottesmanbacteria bacterium RIFCSPHIGHO2_02_FULL_39_11 TaxID=1798382 RepID=A0A1F5ZJW4_9BACT|nr:MAG: hypothetical protein A3D77_07015 [Candidatus Gottesmanbacteria bacterium RIFCSPHIGHO2_02_FULL_39_11]
MKKIIAVLSAFFLFFFFWGLFTQTVSQTEADWWVRPTEREAQPTREPRVSLAPRTPSPTDSPTPKPTGSSPSDQNPCAPGQSFTGTNCGWSPGISEYKHDPEGSSSQAVGYGIGGPDVLGLSYTGSVSSNKISSSDVIFLLGVLCLLVYTKSKLRAKIR